MLALREVKASLVIETPWRTRSGTGSCTGLREVKASLVIEM
jgi:hypothetical protein